MDKKDEAIYKTLYDAYVYAVPLVLFDLTEKFFTNTVEVTREKAPVNRLHHARALSSPKTLDLLFPNVDTLYSQVYYDLSNGPFLFEKPETGRYCSMQLMDAYIHTAAILGTGGADDGRAATYAFLPPGYQGSLPAGVSGIPVPTNKMWMLIRTLVENEDDLKNVYEIQDRMRTYPLSCPNGETWDPPRGCCSREYEYVPIEKLRAMDVETFFNRFNVLSAENPGHPDDAPALERFKALGVGAGLTFCPADFSDAVRARLAALPAQAERDVLEKNKVYELVHGWIYMNPEIGLYGTDYVLRAAVAYGGTANPMSMAAYITAVSDRDNEPLSGKNEYVMHFEAGQAPPSGENAFWSVTAYSRGYLIENPLNKYTVNNRSALTWAPDGSLDIFIGRERRPDVPEGNFLPVDENEFMMTMRIYRPRPSLFDKTWKPPYVEKILSK